MNPWVAILRRHPVVRASAAAIFLYGLAGAATSPYQSVIGIRELGLSDAEYATIALAASITNVFMAIAIGALSDRFQSYRRPLIVAAAFGILGYGTIWAAPSAIVFALATVGPLALFHATNSLLFGNVSAQTARLHADDAQIVNALMRMAISLSWVLVPGAVGLLMIGRDSMIGAYLIAALAAAACLATIVLGLAPDHPRRPLRRSETTPDAIPEGGTGTARVAPSSGRADRPVQVRLPGSVIGDMAQIFRPSLLAPVIGIALISQVLHVNGAVLPLIMTGQAGGQTGDVGFAVGMVALLEVVFMFGWTWSLRYLRVTTALGLSIAIYMGYLVGLALASDPAHIFAASLLAGIGAAGIISIPISYLLDLIQDRPGLSASLIAVNMFLGGAIGAGIFAMGTALQGYPAAAILSGIGGLAGAGLLILLERKSR
ncbi:MFS transporter [Paracoccus aurantiacus]|uniref:MFS transporter n=1 Tax=Paracoccus aurantiacus TaxID=2599412 RepID=A0A5C6S389_9RHOB|nr:MFS transporter [Paracoccus aurantiacus]TXB69288.1 MFS transporter [Paracoccus aurantiacus]